MAEIHADKEVVQATAKLLLSLTSDPNDVSMSHGPRGMVFLVPDGLAERFVQAVQRQEVDADAKKKKGK